MPFMDAITMRRGHLEEIRDALDTAFSFHAAEDIQEAARSVGGRSRQSRLTALLEQNLERVSGYLAEGLEDEQLPVE